MGRADQSIRIERIFVRAEQVAALAARHPEVSRVRIQAVRVGETDDMVVKIETERADPAF